MNGNSLRAKSPCMDKEASSNILMIRVDAFFLSLRANRE